LNANGIDLNQVEWYADKESGRPLQWLAFDRLQKCFFNGKKCAIL